MRTRIEDQATGETSRPQGEGVAFAAAVPAPNQGGGNDFYIVYSPDDVVIENPDEGIDTVYAFISYTLPDNVENLYVSGSNVLTGRGNALNNLLVSNGAVNFLYGGAGDDTYEIQQAGDMVEEAHFEGTDTIYSWTSYSLFGRAVENFYMMGNDDLAVSGNSLNNILAGNPGDNVLDGGVGADSMSGGAGDDTFVVGAASDVVIELDGEGTDLVQSTVGKYTLAANVENLTLVGDSHWYQEGTGNALDNVLTDAHGNTSRLRGGPGNDTYYFDDNYDYAFEDAGEGYDVVYSTGSVSIANEYIERVVLLGDANSGINGNSIRNILIGNSGNNQIAGWGGGDHMEGGPGNDTYFVWDARDEAIEKAGEGSDTVLSNISYDLRGTYVESLWLTFYSDGLNATGNSLANSLRGGDGANILTGLGGHDRLDGSGGADTLVGGTGNDTCVVDHAGDVVSESRGEGLDLVEASVSYGLSAWVENLSLTGTDAINGTGNSLSNVLTGNSGVNILTGGAGNDTYFVQNASDNVVEVNGEGTDVIFSSATYSLGGRYIEVLTLTGAGNINASGNSLANTLVGNSGANILNGRAGDDRLEGGLGSDIFLFQLGSGIDTVADFSATQNDSINVNAYTGGLANTGLVSQSGAHVIITLSAGNVVTVENATTADVLAHMVW